MSSPPSPLFDMPPIRFIAIASVSWASGESAPRLIAPVEKRLTISARRLDLLDRERVAASSKLSSPRSSARAPFSSLTRRLNSS